MAFIPTIKVARCALKYRLHSQDVVNTLWFRKTGLGDIDSTDLANLNVELKDWSVINLLPHLSVDISLVSITSTSQDSLTAPSVEQAMSEQGAAVGASLPGNCCLTVKFNTQQRGRSGRGRNYVGGLREADVNGNAVNNFFLNAVFTGYNALVSTPPPGWEWVVVSHFLDKEPREFGFAQTVISASVVDANVDSQRRRLSGRGS